MSELRVVSYYLLNNNVNKKYNTFFTMCKTSNMSSMS